MKKNLFILIIALLVSCGIQKQNKLDNYNIRWNTPSENHHGSMPIGNGDIGLNVWVEENGDLLFYIGKTDSWGDNGRLLKVGKVRVRCEPQLFEPGDLFEQELDLKSGTIKISSISINNSNRPEIMLSIWVDANNPVINISQESSEPVKMTASIELWRTEPSALSEIGVSDLLENRSKPGRLHEPVIVEADSIIKNLKKSIGWYHFNRKSVGFDLTNKLQALSEYFTEDPILHRTSGTIITGTKVKRVNDLTLVTEKEKSNNLSLFVITKHPTKPDEWIATVKELIAQTEKKTLSERRMSHEEWWNNFWERSRLFAVPSGETELNDTSEAFIVTRAYNLQRFIDASGGRGQYPIKFNGSIFTVPFPNKPGDADYRRWGPGYWWQNSRLPYLSMCTSGDYDLMKPFFKMYADDILKVSKFRTNKYFGFDGAYFPECMYFWGSTFTATYGWTPYEERSDKLQESGWHKWEWVSSLELAFMMLDYYDYTLDEKFLKNKVIPLANNVMIFFNNYYNTNDSGKLVMHPSMACETWWDCTNPMPELAGLHSICKRLIALPENLTNKRDREFWETLSEKLPSIPLRETPSGTALAPAEKFAEKRNVENPELYAVFPFRLYGVGNPNLDWAKNALEHRWDRGAFGWRQDDIFMTYLGLTDQAKEYLVTRAKNYDKNSRFPAFWGPNYDWTPDQDHGGVLMKTFQSMLIQTDPYSNKVYLMPAWPKEWDCEFKLNAPYKTTIEGEVLKGVLVNLIVTPESRRKDIIIVE